MEVHHGSIAITHRDESRGTQAGGRQGGHTRAPHELRALEEGAAPLIQHGGDRLASLLDLLVRISRLGAGDGHHPVHVRMLQGHDLAAWNTGAARLRLRGRSAFQELSQPECHALLPDPRWARHEERLREASGVEGVGQPPAHVEMPGETL